MGSRKFQVLAPLSETGGGCQKAGANLSGTSALSKPAHGPTGPGSYCAGGNGVTVCSHDATSCTRWLTWGLVLPLELGGRQPPGQLGRVRHRDGETHRDAHLLHHPVVAEAGRILVAGLVVAVGVVLVLLLRAPPLGAGHEVEPRLERERGHAGAGEREVVGAVKGAPHVGEMTHGE